MATPAAQRRAAGPRGGGTPGDRYSYPDTPGMLTHSQQKAGVHLRSAPLEPSSRRGDSSTKPMVEKALAFRLKQHPSTSACS